MTQFEALQVAKQQADTVSALADLATMAAAAKAVVLKLPEGDPRPDSPARDVVLRFPLRAQAAAFLDALRRSAAITSEMDHLTRAAEAASAATK